jgi:hypothetical protein
MRRGPETQVVRAKYRGPETQVLRAKWSNTRVYCTSLCKNTAAATEEELILQSRSQIPGPEMDYTNLAIR